jgi:hypothetical protein
MRHASAPTIPIAVFAFIFQSLGFEAAIRGRLEVIGKGSGRFSRGRQSPPA